MKNADRQRSGLLLIPRHSVLAIFVFVTSYALALNPSFADHSTVHNVGFPSELKIDAFAIANSRTKFLPDAPAGKVTVQLLATVTKAAFPGKFKFHLAAPEMKELFHTVREDKGTRVARGQELVNGIAFVEPGKFYSLQVVFENPAESQVRFLVGAPSVDPSIALPFARARCWCAAIPFLVRGGGTFSRTIEVGVGPDTPVGAKAIVEWPVVMLKNGEE